MYRGVCRRCSCLYHCLLSFNNTWRSQTLTREHAARYLKVFCVEPATESETTDEIVFGPISAAFRECEKGRRHKNPISHMSMGGYHRRVPPAAIVETVSLDTQVYVAT